jgi:predicted phosphodiesterase
MSYAAALRTVQAADEETPHVHAQNRPDVDPLAEPDRIAVAGDWHGDAAWAYDAAETAVHANIQAIVHLGDFGYRFHPNYLRTLDNALSSHRVPLLFVDGNHEDHKWLARQPVDGRGLRRISDWVWHLPRGFRWTWHGLRFLALGGAHSVDGIWRRQQNLMWHVEERITRADVARAVAGGRADVLVSHDCPTGVVIPTVDDRTEPAPFPEIELLRAEEHRQILRGVVDQVQPRVVWHGHYHVAYETYVDLGYGPVLVAGLDCDGTTPAENVSIVDLPALVQQVKEAA